MKASTVFALAVALLIALAAAATAKYTGLFKSKEPPPAAAAPPPYRVLVAALNLFEEQALNSTHVSVRDLRPDEQAQLEARFGSAWRERLMPAVPAAAFMRVCRQSIPADQILLKDYFLDVGMPDSLSLRLEPNHRAVTVAVQKDKAGGGTLRVGEFVDVLLTTQVPNGAGGTSLRTACIAKACKVVMKRNSLFQTVQADPDDQPIRFTLQANPYRTALIDYVQSLGQISLLPVPAPGVKPGGSFSDPTSKEYATEDQRVDAINRGELTIGDQDLARIFNILPAAPQQQARRIQHLSGVAHVGTTQFMPGSGVTMPGSEAEESVKPAGGTESAPAAPGSGVSPPNGSMFRMPNAIPPADGKSRLQSMGK